MTVQIHGNPYTTVAERCCLAHADEGFSMLGEEVVEIKERHFIRITIDVKGKLYIGSAEIHWNANPKSAEGGNPYETAQTSALGRALGFASYGVIDSVASADEVVRSEQRQPVSKDEALHDLARPQPAQPATVKNTLHGSPASPNQLEEISRLAKALGKQVKRPATYAEADKLHTELAREFNAREAQSA